MRFGEGEGANLSLFYISLLFAIFSFGSDRRRVISEKEWMV